MLSSPWSGRRPLRGQDAVPLSTTQAAANVLCLPSGLPSALWLPALSCGLSCCCPESVAAPPQVVSYSTLQRPWRASWRRPRGAASGSLVLRRPLPTSRAVRCSVRPLGEQQSAVTPADVRGAGLGFWPTAAWAGGDRGAGSPWPAQVAHHPYDSISQVLHSCPWPPGPRGLGQGHTRTEK